MLGTYYGVPDDQQGREVLLPEVRSALRARSARRRLPDARASRFLCACASVRACSQECAVMHVCKAPVLHHVSCKLQVVELLQRDFASHVWCTYRKGFPAIGQWRRLFCSHAPHLDAGSSSGFGCCIVVLLRGCSHLLNPSWTLNRACVCAGDTLLTSDVGWGCTLRSGQMLLAEVFARACACVRACAARACAPAQ